MTTDPVTVGNSIALLVPIALFILLNHAVNLKKKNRSRQFLMPFFALAVCLATIFFSDRLRVVLHRAGEILKSAGFGLAAFLDSVFSTDLTSALRNIIGREMRAWLVYMTASVVFIVGYLLLKIIFLNILRPLMRENNPFYRFGAGTFYEKSDEDGIWYLKSGFVQAAQYIRTFYVMAILLAGAMVIRTWRMTADGTLKYPYFPLPVLALLGEVCFLFSGLIKKPSDGTLEGEQESARRVVQYDSVRSALRRLFGDKLYADNVDARGHMAEKRSRDEILSGIEEKEDRTDEAYAAFVRRRMSEGMEFDQNYISSGSALLGGTSIVFNDPFYRDLIPYIFYPMNRTLLEHRKVLVLLGRNGQEEDIEKWLREGFAAVNGMDSMWRIGFLAKTETVPDVGILRRSEINDLGVISAGSAFFEACGFGVIAEPSKLVTTAQIGLSAVAHSVPSGTGEMTWCAFDQNCDGLVDTLSHILMTEFTEVAATEHTKAVSSYMCWEGDGSHMQHRMLPNLSRFLGLGTEIAFTALKNQISDVTWYGGEAFPVIDIRWIARQYYFDLLQYADLPAEPGIVDEHFHVTADLWSAGKSKNSFLIAEDENCNMFEAKREFSTRASEQVFVNIISPAYLLADYMAENESIFSADPKAIPKIVADYAHTKRNVALRLLMRMAAGSVPEEDLRSELLMAGEDVKRLNGEELLEAFWKQVCLCYQPICADNGSDLYDVPENKAGLCFFRWTDPERRRECSFDRTVVRKKRRYNMNTGRTENLYSIEDRDVLRLIDRDLRIANYIDENEKEGANYLGGRLTGHIYQEYLPGQFTTFSGKYYQMERVTPDGQALMRRAADHITGRPVYRQIRTYTLRHITENPLVGSRMNVGGMLLEELQADIRVETPAYWNMEAGNRFDTAKKVEVSGIPDRIYNNKTILRIGFPEAENGTEFTPERCHTLTVLMNEVFQTMFAGDQAYIAALCGAGGEGPVPETYHLETPEEAEPDPRSIYIVEDSQLDLGLLTAVRRSLDRILRVVCDYLAWNAEEIEKSMHPEEKPAVPAFRPPVEEEEKKEEKKKKKFRTRVREFFAKIFRRKKKTERDRAGEGQDSPAEQTKSSAEADSPDAAGTADSRAMQMSGISPEQSAARADLEFEDPKVKKTEDTAALNERKPYHRRYYLLYGYEAAPEGFDLEGTRVYLSALGYDRGELADTRKGKDISDRLEKTFHPGLAGHHYCDFCGRELLGTEYEVLSDGRERCVRCSRTAVKTEEEFRKIFDAVREDMRIFYGVRPDVPVHVKMVNAQTLNRAARGSFVPTAGFDSRSTGIAVKKGGEFTLMVENGAPELSSAMTVCHELTHIWQYTHWDEKQIRDRYGNDRVLLIYEGMAKWAEIQYAYLLGEEETAKREEIMTRMRDDEYGKGFRLFAAKYPFVRSGELIHGSPFGDPKAPL